MSFFTNANNTTIYGGVFTNHAQVIEGLNDAFGGHVAVGAFHNSAERFDPPKCHPHTREAVLKRIMQWVDDPSNQALIMWIFGPMGAGKSAIAQSIADFCFHSDNLAASFFFSRNSVGRDNSVQFITTLAYQISHSIPEIQAAVAKALKDDPFLLSRSLDAQAYALITRPLNDATSTIGNSDVLKSRPRLVIIDGLDECGKPKDQRYLLEVLTKMLKRLSYPLLFLVASRPEQVIRDAFNREPLRTLTTRLALDDAYQADSDIRIFLQSKFDEIKENHPAGGDLPSPWPSSEELTRLVEKSSGQFVYASTVIKFVDSSHHLPQDRLDIVFGLAPPELATPFAELDALYHQIFSSIVYIENVLEILTVLLLFKYLRPCPDLLDHFLSYKPGTTRMRLSDLHSVLRLPPPEVEDDVIKIMHASLSEFLLDPHRSGDYCIDEDAGLDAITRRILKCVLKTDNPDIFIKACYVALPAFVPQITPPGHELLDGLFSFDLERYVAWYKVHGRYNSEIVATFFIWMKDKFHPNYDGNLFHWHIQAIDTWIVDQYIERFIPTHLMLTSISVFRSPGLHSGIEPDILSADSDVLMLMIIVEATHATKIYLNLPSTYYFPAVDCLVRDFLVEPGRRGEQYRFDGDVCARLARKLWIYIVSHNLKISNTIEDPKFAFHKIVFHDVWRISRNSLSPHLIYRYEPEQALALLRRILPKVLEAGVDTLDDFLQFVQDHPLSKYTDPADRMYDLYKPAADAAEKLLDRELFQQMRERRVLREREAHTPAGPPTEIQQDAPVSDARHNNLNLMPSPFAIEAPTFWWKMYLVANILPRLIIFYLVPLPNWSAGNALTKEQYECEASEDCALGAHS